MSPDLIGIGNKDTVPQPVGSMAIFITITTEGGVHNHLR